jgi:hypothetical protein
MGKIFAVLVRRLACISSHENKLREKLTWKIVSNVFFVI